MKCLNCSDSHIKSDDKGNRECLVCGFKWFFATTRGVVSHYNEKVTL